VLHPGTLRVPPASLQGSSSQKGRAMLRKTMRVGEVRTSIKLEPEFWDYLQGLARERGLRLTGLVNEIAAATPDRTNLASTLRLFALEQAKLRTQTSRRELDQLLLAGNTQDLTRVLEACPLPCLVLDQERTIRELNRAFALWLNVEPKATLGKRLDAVMIVRALNGKEMWAGLADGRLARAAFNATYISPGRVRTAQAIVVALGGDGVRHYVVLFETLAGRV
jgi:predicted DNA-binding ribbon-helix-helix protein